MPLKLILGEKNVQELLVCLFVGRLHPLLQLVYVEVVLFCLERRLEADIEDPILLITAPADKIDSFACLQDLVRQIVRQKGWNHHVVQFILLRPELVIADVWVCFYEEFLEWVIDLASDHPCLDHGQDRC